MWQDVGKKLVLGSIRAGWRWPRGAMERVGELLFLKDLLGQLEVDCVLDVGANRGQFARELRQIGYSGTIVSFEPLGSEFELLRQRFEGDRAWRGYHFALGSANESKSIMVPKLTVMSSLLEPVGGKGEHRTETIEMRRLEGVLPEVAKDFGAKRIFLKMDTQGYDLEVFKGAGAWAERICGLQGELSVQPFYKGMPRYLEAIGVYEAAGFELYNLTPVNRDEGCGALVEMNCFMRRSG